MRKTLLVIFLKFSIESCALNRRGSRILAKGLESPISNNNKKFKKSILYWIFSNQEVRSCHLGWGVQLRFRDPPIYPLCLRPAEEPRVGALHLVFVLLTSKTPNRLIHSAC